MMTSQQEKDHNKQIFCVVAGLSFIAIILIGGFLAKYLRHRISNFSLQCFNAAAAGMFLALAFFHILPEALIGIIKHVVKIVAKGKNVQLDDATQDGMADAIEDRFHICGVLIFCGYAMILFFERVVANLFLKAPEAKDVRTVNVQLASRSEVLPSSSQLVLNDDLSKPLMDGQVRSSQVVHDPRTHPASSSCSKPILSTPCKATAVSPDVNHGVSGCSKSSSSGKSCSKNSDKKQSPIFQEGADLDVDSNADTLSTSPYVSSKVIVVRCNRPEHDHPDCDDVLPNHGHKKTTDQSIPADSQGSTQSQEKHACLRNACPHFSERQEEACNHEDSPLHTCQGHAHSVPQDTNFISAIFLLLALSIHGISEGYVAGSIFTGDDWAPALGFVAAVVAHKWIEGFVVMLSLLKNEDTTDGTTLESSDKKVEKTPKLRIVIFMSIVALASPLGLLINLLFSEQHIDWVSPYVNAFAVGTLVYVALTEIIPETFVDTGKFGKSMFKYTLFWIAGAALMWFIWKFDTCNDIPKEKDSPVVSSTVALSSKSSSFMQQES